MARTFCGLGITTAPATKLTAACEYVVWNYFRNGQKQIEIADAPPSESCNDCIRVEGLEGPEKLFLSVHSNSEHLRKILAAAAWAGFKFCEAEALMPSLPSAERRFWERNLAIQPIAKKFIAAGARLTHFR